MYSMQCICMLRPFLLQNSLFNMLTLVDCHDRQHVSVYVAMVSRYSWNICEILYVERFILGTLKIILFETFQYKCPQVYKLVEKHWKQKCKFELLFQLQYTHSNAAITAITQLCKKKFISWQLAFTYFLISKMQSVFLYHVRQDFRVY